MHCRPLRTATLKLELSARATDWQSEPRRLVSAPTSSLSKKSTGCSISRLNTRDLQAAVVKLHGLYGMYGIRVRQRVPSMLKCWSSCH